MGQHDEHDETETPGEPDEPASPPRRYPASSAVDLGMWARGEWPYLQYEVALALDDYILTEIAKLIHARSVVVKDRGQALRFLIEEGIVGENEARKDL